MIKEGIYNALYTLQYVAQMNKLVYFFQARRGSNNKNIIALFNALG